MPKVLVVDDEDVLLEMIVLLIEDLGYEALTAANGQEALALLHAEIQPPALIISDVMMPRMSGTELARVVKSHPRLVSIPIILMSAAFQPLAGRIADQFLHKPFTLEDLEALVVQYAGNTGTGQDTFGTTA